MAIRFSIEVTKVRATVWLVVLRGDHDIATSGDVRGRLRGPIDDTNANVIVDLAAATFIDSTVLAEIVLARQQVDRTPGRRLVLVVPEDSPAASLLAVVDSDARLFTRFESRADAVDWADRGHVE